MSRSGICNCAIALVTTLFLSASAGAQAFRTYLASTGVDGPSCSRSAPCRLLPAALAAVAPGGEVWMLDSANYNTATVSITKSVTILAVPGAVGSVVSTGGGSAIDISTAGVKVTLRNLAIGPLPGGDGTAGITVGGTATVTVENCLIANLPSFGIVTNGDVNLHVTDSTIRDNGDAGIWLLANTRATIARTLVENNAATGVFMIGSTSGTTSRLDIVASTLSGNGNGVLAWSEGSTAEVHASIKDSHIVRSSNIGVSTRSTVGANVWVTLSGNSITNNGTGVEAQSPGAKVLAYGNTVTGNVFGFVRGTGVFETSGHNTVRNNGADTVGAITPVSTM
jgi:hypothetical protein